jgi:hypothetical protein
MDKKKGSGKNNRIGTGCSKEDWSTEVKKGG